MEQNEKHEETKLQEPKGEQKEHAGYRMGVTLKEKGKGGIKIKKNIAIAIGVVAILIVAFLLFAAMYSPAKTAEKNSPIIQGSNNSQFLPQENNTANASLPSIELIEIADTKCADCFNVKELTDVIKTLELTIKSEKSIAFDSTEGKALVAKYKIEKVPTLIITGEIEKSQKLMEGLSQVGRFSDGNRTFVLEKMIPVYYDLNEQKYKGRVSTILVEEKTCEKCQDYNKVIDSLKTSGVKFSTNEVINASSKEGIALIAKYKIEKIPTLIFSQDAEEYDFLMTALKEVATKEADQNYVLRQITPPYINVSNSKLVGIVDVTSLVDKSCKNCYDTKIHLDLLPQYGMAIGNLKTIDVSTPEGKALVAKYNIDEIPTILLSKEAADYPVFAKVWLQVGTTESDGIMIFRNMSVLGTMTYKSLKTNVTFNENQTITAIANTTQ